MFTDLKRRPPTMTTPGARRDPPPKPEHVASERTRCPRIGVIHRGSMVAERRFDRRANVSIGRRIDANVLIDRDGIPPKLDVLRLLNGRYHVVLPADPDARLTLRGSPIANVTVQDGGQRLVPVEQAAGGSLQVGDLVIMFQLVPVGGATIAVRENTVLRVGLVFDGRLISDQVFDDHKRVCIGRGRRDRIVLDSDYEGPSLCFRRHKDGTATLIGDEGVDLRVALPDRAPADANSLRSSGLARPHRGAIEVHLPTGSRGRARLGPYTVLYQVLLRRTHVPMMPKRGLVGQFTQALVHDPVWAVSLGLAAVLVCGVLGQAMMFQQKVGRFQAVTQPQLDDHSKIWAVSVARLEPEVPPAAALKPQTKPVDAPKPAADVPAKRDRKTRKKPAKTARKSSGEREVDPDKHERFGRRLAKRTIAGVFTGARSKLVRVDADGDTALFDRAAANQDPSEMAAGPGGAGVKLRGAQGRPTVETVRVKRVRVARRDPTALRTRMPDKHEGKVKVDGLALSPGGDQAPVKRVGRIIARKAGAVRRCYDRALRKDASISGKVSVSFTVGTAGTVTRVLISGATGELASCIKSVFKRARGLPILPMPRLFRQSFVLTAGS